MQSIVNPNFLELLKALSHTNLEWSYEIDESQQYVIHTYWEEYPLKLHSVIGRVDKPHQNALWLLVHELSHLQTTSSYLAKLDNFGLPRDDQHMHPISHISYDDKRLYMHEHKAIHYSITVLSKYLVDMNCLYDALKLIAMKP